MFSRVTASIASVLLVGALGAGCSSISEGLADGGPAPDGIEQTQNPQFSVGTEVTLTADHYDGMKGAPATIVGAYNTTAYSVNYYPTNGGEPVLNHKWVVQEEIDDAGTSELFDGTPVTIHANHEDGLDGAEGTINYSTRETVYMVDYEANDKTYRNHKWLVESEIEPR